MTAALGRRRHPLPLAVAPSTGSGQAPGELLADLQRRGVVLRVDGGRLRWPAPAGAMTVRLAVETKRHQAALLALIAKETTRCPPSPSEPAAAAAASAAAASAASAASTATSASAPTGP